MASNPMFLALLCAHVKEGVPFPEHGHTVFETYVSHRLSRDENRLRERYGVTPAELRPVAEQIAFCMALDATLGLDPTRKQLRESLPRLVSCCHGSLTRA